MVSVNFVYQKIAVKSGSNLGHALECLGSFNGHNEMKSTIGEERRRAKAKRSPICVVPSLSSS